MSRRVLAILIILLVAGCAGRDFKRPAMESLAVGQATEAEIRQRFGAPYREGTVLKNNETMKTLAYAYATTASSAPGGVVPSRGQGFYFWRDVLVGHDFTSSFAEDKTDFDATRAQQIRKGDARATVYLYQETKGTAFWSCSSTPRAWSRRSSSPPPASAKVGSSTDGVRS